MSSALLVSALMSLLFANARPHAGPAPDLLDYNGGAVTAHPAIHNLYMAFNWDSLHGAALQTAAIDGFTTNLVNSSYFANAGQYGVGAASFTGSHQPSPLCVPPIAFGKTDFFAITAWVGCMTTPSPLPFGGTISGIPAPDDNTLYVVYVPRETQIFDAVISTCDGFGAYHLFGTNLIWKLAPLPALVPQTFAYAVVPIDCAVQYAMLHHEPDLIDGVSVGATHEIIEAATDPIILTGWIDNSKAGFSADILNEGEAADLCETVTPVRLMNGVLVSTYWSNRTPEGNPDGRCVPVGHPVALDQTGLPLTVPHEATVDGSLVQLPFTTVVEDGTTVSYAFPSPVNDSNPGIRYVTSEPPGTITVTGDVSTTATYQSEYFLSVDASPPAAAAADATLTPSGWRPSGTLVTLTTDPIIDNGDGSRYRFERWSGDVSGTNVSTTIGMLGPRSVTANYALQHLVTVNTTGLGTNNTRIYNGAMLLGTANDARPLAVFVNDGPLALSADADVNASNGTQFFFQGFAPVPPGTLTAPFTTTAAYKTMAQLIAGALASGEIHGSGAAGLTTSYMQQFAAVEADIVSHNYARALKDLQTFIGHLQAESGKHVVPALASTLELDALLVYHNVLCAAMASGQINASTAEADYAYYSSLESALGGIVLPPC